MTDQTETAEPIVSREEMSALLGANAASRESRDRRERISSYDFRRPDRLSKEHVRSLFLLHDTFAHSLSSSLPIFLRTLSEATLISIEQQAYSAFLAGLPDPTALFALSLKPLDGLCLLELSSSIAFPVIDRMLGGSGAGEAEARAVTEIEQRILESFLSVVIDDLRLAWRPLVELELEICARETRPQMAQIVAPNEVVLVAVFDVAVGEARGRMSLCLPAASLEPLAGRFSPAAYAQHAETPPERTRLVLELLANTEFEIAAELRGTRISAGDLLAAAVGDVLRFDRRTDAPVCVTVGGKWKFDAALVALGDRTAIQLIAKTHR